MSRRLPQLIGAALLAAVPAFPHPDHSLGESSWTFNKDGLVARIDLGANQLAQVPEIQTGGADLRTLSAKRLGEMGPALQSYIDRKLTLTINNKVYRPQITRVAWGHHDFISIWLSLEGLAFDQPINPVTIDYRLLFDETRHNHMNAARIFAGEAEEQGHTFAYDAAVFELTVRGS